MVYLSGVDITTFLGINCCPFKFGMLMCASRTPFRVRLVSKKTTTIPGAGLGVSQREEWIREQDAQYRQHVFFLPCKVTTFLAETWSPKG